MGREKGLEFANQNNLKALFLDYENKIYLSNGVNAKIAQT